MKSLFFIFFIFCLTGLDCIAQENSSANILNTSVEHIANSDKSNQNNDSINDKQAEKNNAKSIDTKSIDTKSIDTKSIDTKQPEKNNTKSIDAKSNEEKFNDAKSTPIKDDKSNIEPNPKSSIAQDSEIIAKKIDKTSIVQDGSIINNEKATSTNMDKIPAKQDMPALPIKTASIQELWHGSIYSSTYKAGVCIAANGELKGVLKLKTAKGDIDTYHFYGSFQNDKIFAKHSSGHIFKGKFASDKQVTGKITLKQGYTIKLKGKRTKNIQLTDSCGPQE